MVFSQLSEMGSGWKLHVKDGSCPASAVVQGLPSTQAHQGLQLQSHLNEPLSDHMRSVNSCHDNANNQSESNQKKPHPQWKTKLSPKVSSEFPIALL